MFHIITERCLLANVILFSACVLRLILSVCNYSFICFLCVTPLPLGTLFLSSVCYIAYINLCRVHLVDMKSSSLFRSWKMFLSPSCSSWCLQNIHSQWKTMTLHLIMHLLCSPGNDLADWRVQWVLLRFLLHWTQKMDHLSSLLKSQLFKCSKR